MAPFYFSSAHHTSGNLTSSHKAPVISSVSFPWFRLGGFVFRGEREKLWVITLIASCHSCVQLALFSSLKKDAL